MNNFNITSSPSIHNQEFEKEYFTLSEFHEKITEKDTDKIVKKREISQITENCNKNKRGLLARRSGFYGFFVSILLIDNYFISKINSFFCRIPAYKKEVEEQLKLLNRIKEETREIEKLKNRVEELSTMIEAWRTNKENYESLYYAENTFQFMMSICGGKEKYESLPILSFETGEKIKITKDTVVEPVMRIQSSQSQVRCFAIRDNEDRVQYFYEVCSGNEFKQEWKADGDRIIPFEVSFIYQGVVRDETNLKKLKELIETGKTKVLTSGRLTREIKLYQKTENMSVKEIISRFEPSPGKTDGKVSSSLKRG